MAQTKSIYRRLGGQGATLTYYARLYLGPDHLLQAASTGYSETYKRFYFRDIQAIIIRKTNLWLFWMMAWLLLALAFAIVALQTIAETAVIFWAITGVLLLGPLINLTLGPTCVCQVRTAVQTEKLPSLKRLRKARKILDQLRPLIENLQGKLAAKDLAMPRTGTVQAGGSATFAPPVIQQDAPPATAAGEASPGTS
jgi:hypothetical protein